MVKASMNGRASLRRISFAAVYLIGTLACGGNTRTPTSPSASPTVPQVAGNYSGDVAFVFTQTGVTLSCPATMTVVQTGASLSIAPMLIRGACGNLSVPLGDVTIDSNGSLGNASVSFTEPSCGVYTSTGSGGFFGREFRMSAIYTSRTCPPFNVTAVLTR